MSYFPKIRLVHTSKRFYGHIYIPMANWLLMIGTVVVTAVYSNVSLTSVHPCGFFPQLVNRSLIFGVPLDYKIRTSVRDLRGTGYVHYYMYGDNSRHHCLAPSLAARPYWFPLLRMP
jgi:K+ potassium transporter